ncbi:MAG TPA: hypothetical protein VJV23_04260 [Candidatus Polarisedimenticolia bacterium]|nr:hypothetical protein [Candidatus Polarisedimenticolia bacterium]
MMLEDDRGPAGTGFGMFERMLKGAMGGKGWRCGEDDPRNGSG